MDHFLSWSFSPLNLIFCILCIIVGALTIVGGILWMVAHASFVSVILGIYFMIIGLYIVIVEIFMPAKLRALMAFYLTWTGKAVVFIFLGVLFIIPYEGRAGGWYPYYLVTAIYNFCVAIGLIILQILGCVGKAASRSQPIIIVETTA